MERMGKRRVLRLIAPDTVDTATLCEYAQMSDRAVRADLHARGLLEAERGRLLRLRWKESDIPLAVVLQAPDAASEDDTSSLAASTPRRLIEHTDGVVDMARRFAERLSLGPTLTHDLMLAARLHDAGKAHPRFQRYMHGGDELVAAGGIVLAKSGRTLGPEARQRAGLPRGARHEVASLRLAEAHPSFAEAYDPALVLWLIGTHHGQGRPLFPAVEWPPPGDSFDADPGGEGGTVHAKPALSAAALTARWLELRETLHRRFGPWWLAHLEAVLRLADHRTSEQESRS
jgi:CRISPR-associated endonuclease/helicase Cas3